MEYFQFLATNALNAVAKKFRAPKGFMFDLYGFYSVPSTVGDNGLFILPTQVEERDEISLDSSGFIWYIDTNINEHTGQMLPKDHPIKTKYISIRSDSGIAFQQLLTLFYELSKASTVELIWEFLKRGKNP